MIEIISFLVALVVVYVPPLLLCHVFVYIMNRYDVKEDYFLESDMLFGVAFVPFANYLVAVLTIMGFIWHIWIRWYRKTKMYKRNIFKNLYYKYVDFIFRGKK